MMRVARLHAWGDVRIELDHVPEPAEGEVVVRIDACGLCGSDALQWYVEKKAPVVLGHEPVGTITAVGAGVTNLSTGDRVFVHHHAPCMKCAECQRRLWSNCATWKGTRLLPGGFAEYASVPSPSVAHDVLLLPPTLDDETATFIEPVACCLRALDKARLAVRDDVLIIGLGAMGLLLGQLARAAGAASVRGLDLIDDRVRLAASLGIESYQAGGRGADVVIVTPGSAAAIEAGIAAAAPGARIVCFTPLDPGRPLALDQCNLYFREIELLQSYSCGPDETRRALALLAEGPIRTVPLVTHRVGLEGVQDALERAHHGDGIKTIVYPHGRRLQEGTPAP
jgi:L-iditol 2-dehydrogenase